MGVEEAERIARAQAGDRAAFDALVAPHQRGLQSFAVRMISHPEDARDVVQDALLGAYQGLAAFRGDASFRTWLFSIITRRCIDHLRARPRWTVLAQTIASDEHVRSDALMGDLREAASAPDFEYDSREHIAYCFSCIGRALEPEDAAAVLLRDVFDLSNDEAAHAVGVTTAVFRHRLAHGRKFMIDTYDGLCALVSKRGPCWQCAELREVLPPERRGRPVLPIAPPDASDDARFEARLAIVRAAKLGTGEEQTRDLHAYILRYMSRAFG